MATLLIRKARVLTLAGGPGPRRGAAMGDLGVLPEGDVIVKEGLIEAVGAHLELPPGAEVIEAFGRVLMPGFIDCHTQLGAPGDRLDDWPKRLDGATERDLAAAGGGAAATVRAVREATQKQLAAVLRERLNRVLQEGTTTIEVKTGHGIQPDHELKQLRAIERAGATWSGTVVPTALLGNRVEGDPEALARLVLKDALPEVTREFPNAAVEARCAADGWSVEACVKLLRKAAKRHAVRVQADETEPGGMIAEAIGLFARCVSHLSASRREDLVALAKSPVMGVILPVTGFHTHGRFARGGTFIDQGGALALATNANPATAPACSMPFAIALAVRCCGLSPAEAITAATVNAAAVLDLKDRGRIEPGLRADLLLLHHRDERQLAYELGGNPVAQVLCAGRPA